MLNTDQLSLAKRLSQACVDMAHQMMVVADLLGEIPAQLEEKKPRQPKAPDMPKYPRSSYILFSHDHRPEARKETKSGKPSDVVTLLAQKWNALSDAEKQPYIIKAKEERKRYDMEMEAYCAKLAAESLGGEPVTTTTSSNGDSSLKKMDGDDQSSSGDTDDSTDSSDSSDGDASSSDSSDDDTSSSDSGSDTGSSDTDSSASQVVKSQVPQPQNLTKPEDAAVNKKESVVKPTEKAKQPVMNKNITKHSITSKQSIKGKQPAKSIEKKPTKSIEKKSTKPIGKHSHESIKRPSSSLSHDTQSNKVKKPKLLKH